MSGGGGSSTPRSRDQPPRRSTLGSKGGRNGGASEDPCDITDITTLNSPERKVLVTLRDGDVLTIELRDERRLVATIGGNVAGSVTSASHARIVQCMHDGREYEALVLSVRGGACEVMVRPK